MSHASELSQWQQQIQAGNDCFNEHQTLSALSHYNLAKVHAESMLAHFEDTKAAVAAVVISYHNLADLYLRENEYILAECELRHVHRKLSIALSDATPNSIGVDALLWGVSKTYIALINHLKNLPRQVKSQIPSVPNLFEKTFKNTLN